MGLAVLAWSGLKLFRALDRAFDRIYGIDRTPSLTDRLVDTAVAVVAVSTAAILVATGVALSVVPAGGPVLDLFGTIALIAALTVAFLPLYVMLPPVSVSIREAVPGAAVAAVGWVGLQVGFRVYAAAAGQFAVYGVLGSVLLFVTWLYVASAVVLLGAAVTAVACRSSPFDPGRGPGGAVAPPAE